MAEKTYIVKEVEIIGDKTSFTLEDAETRKTTTHIRPKNINVKKGDKIIMKNGHDIVQIIKEETQTKIEEKTEYNASDTTTQTNESATSIAQVQISKIAKTNEFTTILQAIQQVDEETMKMIVEIKKEIIKKLFEMNKIDKVQYIVEFKRKDGSKNHIITRAGVLFIMKLLGIKFCGYKKGENEGEYIVCLEDAFGKKFWGWGTCKRSEHGKENFDEKALIATAITRAMRKAITQEYGLTNIEKYI